MKAVVFIRWLALSLSATAAHPAVVPTLAMRVYNLARMQESDLEKACHETTKIFRAAGIQLAWTTGDLEAHEAHVLDMTVNPQRTADAVPRVIVVRIVRSADPAYPPEVLGRALPWAQSGAHVTLFLHHIEYARQEHSIELSTLAAYALAHEVGHILLRSDPAPHSPQGLMRAEWGFAEYQRISHGALKFTQREAAAMRAALAAPSGFSHDFLCLAQRIGPR